MAEQKRRRGRLALDLNMAGRGTVELDGRDVSEYLRSVDIHAGIHEATTASLEYLGGVVTELDALVTHVVYVGPYAGRGGTLREALESLLVNYDRVESARLTEGDGG